MRTAGCRRRNRHSRVSDRALASRTTWVGSGRRLRMDMRSVWRTHTATCLARSATNYDEDPTRGGYVLYLPPHARRQDKRTQPTFAVQHVVCPCAGRVVAKEYVRVHVLRAKLARKGHRIAASSSTICTDVACMVARRDSSHVALSNRAWKIQQGRPRSVNSDSPRRMQQRI